MPLKIITPPAIEPVTLTELKAHLRITHDDEDSILTTYLQAARMYTETTLCWRAFIEQELELVKDYFPRYQEGSEIIKLPRPPLQSVTSITYRTRDGTVETVDAADYIVDTDSEPARIVPAVDETWPSDSLYPVNAVRVRYTAGYPTYYGTVDTVDTTRAVTRTAGDEFNMDWPAGQQIVINGVLYQVASVATTDLLTVTTAPGDQTGAAYSAHEVPTEIRQGILILAGHFFEVREPVVIGTSVMVVPMTVEALLMPYRAWGGDVG